MTLPLSRGGQGSDSASQRGRGVFGVWATEAVSSEEPGKEVNDGAAELGQPENPRKEPGLCGMWWSELGLVPEHEAPTCREGLAGSGQMR